MKKQTQLEIANNPNTKKEILSELFYKTTNKKVKIAIAANPNISIELMIDTINKGFYLNENPILPVFMLENPDFINSFNNSYKRIKNLHTSMVDLILKNCIELDRGYIAEIRIGAFLNKEQLIFLKNFCFEKNWKYYNFADGVLNTGDLNFLIEFYDTLYNNHFNGANAILYTALRRKHKITWQQLIPILKTKLTNKIAISVLDLIENSQWTEKEKKSFLIRNIRYFRKPK